MRSFFSKLRTAALALATGLSVFGLLEAASALNVPVLDRLEKNERLYAEGSIRVSAWTTAAGEKRTVLSMARRFQSRDRGGGPMVVLPV
jgi:hypothetical protein